jgi:hypothetical protein
MEATENIATVRPPWNKGKIVGQKAPFKLKEIWAIRVRLQLAVRRRELALFNLAIDSKLRACDLVSLRVRDVCHGQTVASRTIVLQQKTQRPVQFEITEPTREAVGAWIGHAPINPPIRTNCGLLGEADRIGAEFPPIGPTRFPRLGTT